MCEFGYFCDFLFDFANEKPVVMDINSSIIMHVVSPRIWNILPGVISFLSIYIRNEFLINRLSRRKKVDVTIA